MLFAIIYYLALGAGVAGFGCCFCEQMGTSMPRLSLQHWLGGINRRWKGSVCLLGMKIPCYSSIPPTVNGDVEFTSVAKDLPRLLVGVNFTMKEFVIQL